jgi:hypothetical protein
MKSLVLFIFGASLFGAFSLGIGYWAAERETIVQGSVAFALTFVPAAATLAWVVLSYRSAPEMRLLASLGGSGVRLAVALGGGLFLMNTKPQLSDTPFWCWLVLFYLVFLGLEITLLVRQQPKLNGPPQA